MCSQEIEWKPNYDGGNDRMMDRRNDGQPKSSIALLFKRGAITRNCVYETLCTQPLFCR